MDPDVVRMYSSSPPPLDEDGEEEDEDDFGDFGGYCGGVSSSFSFSECDTFSQPEKKVSLEETEKITKDQEAENPETMVSKSDVALDYDNRKVEVSDILLNGPLSSDSQKLCAVSVTGTQSTSELQDSKLGGKNEHSHNPNIDQMGHCLSNGPITLCTGKVPEHLTLTSTNRAECKLVSRAEDSSIETDKASTAEGSTDSLQLLEDTISQGEVSEASDALEGDGITESQEVDSDMAVEDQSNKEKMEEEAEEDLRSGHCGSSDGPDSKMQIRSGSEDLGDVANTSLAPLVPMSETLDCKKTTVSPVVQGPHVVPGRVQLEEEFDEVCLPVVDPETVHDMEADPVITDIKRIVVGSSLESDEDFGDFRDATQGFPDISQTESMSQEGFADFVTALSDCSSHDEFADTDILKDLKEEEELAVDNKHDDDDDDAAHAINNPQRMCSELTPSDSFADFSSAPFGGPAGTTGESWAEFGEHKECEVQQESWAAFVEEQQSNTATAPSTDSLKTDNALFGLSHKLQHLFKSTFPSEMAPEDPDVPTLQVLLESQDHAEIRESISIWRHLLDIDNAYGFKVQWVGSHSNQILLDCLGIYNIMFTGQNKQPVLVPMFAAGLGMLEPTKEPVKSSCIFSASSPGQGRSTLCAQQVVSSLSLEDDGTSQRRASFSVTQRKSTRHSRQKSYS